MNGDEPRAGFLRTSDAPRATFDRQEASEFIAHQVKISLAEYQINTQRMLEETRAGNEAGTEAIKAVTLINGGAAVAVLAFVGHLASVHATPATITNFVRPLDLFVWGVFAGAVASGVVYVTHVCYFKALDHEFAAKTARDNSNQKLAATEDQTSTRWNRAGNRVANPIAFIVGLASLVCFAIGCYQAYHAFKSGTISNSTEGQPSFPHEFFFE